MNNRKTININMFFYIYNYILNNSFYALNIMLFFKNKCFNIKYYCIYFLN